MKKMLLLLAFITFLCPIANGQSKIKYHTISLKDKKDTPITYYSFYVENVYDGRQFKENIGTVQTGAFNKKVVANFDKPFEQEIKEYLTTTLPKNEKLLPVSIRINELYISEVTKSTSENGFANVVLDVIVQKDGVDYIAGTYAGSADSTAEAALDVTGKHDKRIKQALLKCLGQFQALPRNTALTIVYDNTEAVTTLLPATPNKGIYISYRDLLNNKPLDDANFYTTQKEDQLKLISSVTGFEANDYYAYCDGTTLFINVGKYAVTKYYAKTQRIGNNYFIDNVFYDYNNAVSWGAMFGAIGVLLASTEGDGIAPLLIDGHTGQPTYLTNGTIKELLKPQPELLKEYKDSKKTTADIKAVLAKFYSETSK